MHGSTSAGNGRGGQHDGCQRWGLKPNRHRYDDALSRVHHVQFEHLMADHFRDQGWQVEVVGAEARGQSFDRGIDLKLRRDGQYVLVQCKHWTACQVPHNHVHQLLGVMQSEGATGAIIVTSGEFTGAACTAAARSGHIQLLDGVAVRRLLDPAAIERAASASESRGEPRMSAVDFGDVMGDRRRSSYRRPRPPRALKIVAGLVGVALCR